MLSGLVWRGMLLEFWGLRYGPITDQKRFEGTIQPSLWVRASSGSGVPGDVNSEEIYVSKRCLRGLRLHLRVLSSCLGVVREPLAQPGCTYGLLPLMGVSGASIHASSETGDRLRRGVDQLDVEVE